MYKLVKGSEIWHYFSTSVMDTINEVVTDIVDKTKLNHEKILLSGGFKIENIASPDDRKKKINLWVEFDCSVIKEGFFKAKRIEGIGIIQIIVYDQGTIPDIVLDRFNLLKKDDSVLIKNL